MKNKCSYYIYTQYYVLHVINDFYILLYAM